MCVHSLKRHTTEIEKAASRSAAHAPSANRNYDNFVGQNSCINRPHKTATKRGTRLDVRTAAISAISSVELQRSVYAAQMISGRASICRDRGDTLWAVR